MQNSSHIFSIFKHKKLHVESYIQIILGYLEFRNARLKIDDTITHYFF